MVAWCELSSPERLTVIGGSSPFTLSFAAELARQPPWDHGTLTLTGRNVPALAAVTRCADAMLRPIGWSASMSASLALAVAEADVILHQNRYGGLAGRAADERLAAATASAPDETLGPAGLALSLRTWWGQQRITASLPPRAVPVLTMTNPLGVSTAAFSAAGAPVLGLCELPVATLQKIRLAAGLPSGAIRGAYVGHNHRGFWYHLEHQGDDLVDRLCSSLPPAEAETVARLHAVPDKYHALACGRAATPIGRATTLERIRAEALREACMNPQAYPPALDQRATPWYRLIILPVLHALAGRKSELIVTRVGSDGVTVEEVVELEGANLRRLPQPSPPAGVAEWHERFHAHEQAILHAASHPTLETIEQALSLDPTVRPRVRHEAALAVLTGFREWLSAEATT
jgi:6-phospho-beta-glucosidase